MSNFSKRQVALAEDGVARMVVAPRRKAAEPVGRFDRQALAYASHRLPTGFRNDGNPDFETPFTGAAVEFRAIFFELRTTGDV